MEHYVTLFDQGFFPQGLALHRSMLRHAGEFTLWVLCVDDVVYAGLERLQLPNLRILRLADVETDALRKVRPGRSRGEYCWTLTPFSADFVFAQDPMVSRVTYVDADIWFAKSPNIVFEEFEQSGKCVLITPHGYAPEYDQADVTGEFCVQFVVFDRERSLALRRRWQAQCLQWCFARSEDGKFGDQKYLDEWPRAYAELVHVSNRLELFQAPWNASRFPPAECHVYHFHGLRLMRHGRVLLAGHYRIPRSTDRIIYQPYLNDLSQGIGTLAAVGIPLNPQLTGSAAVVRLRIAALQLRQRLREWARPVFRKLPAVGRVE